MKRNNSLKIINKRTIRLVLYQVIMAIFFALLIYQSVPINLDSCEASTITVEDKKFSSSKSSSKCILFYESKRHEIMSDKYTARELYDKIAIGTELDIIYTFRYDFFGKYRLIVQASHGTNVYGTLESFNAQREIVVTVVIIFCSVAEAVFLVVCFFTLFPYKKFFKKKKQNFK